MIGRLSSRRGIGPTGIRAGIRAVVADADWHPFAQISARCADRVPPETALREYLHCNPGSTRPLWVKVELGRQRILVKALRQMRLEATPARAVVERSYRLSPAAADQRRPGSLRRAPDGKWR